ncbi:MAG TPA: fumarate hydratase [bacterium]|nr:fumarate hydratase [bacterium]
MKKISCSKIIETVSLLVSETSRVLPEEVKELLKKSFFHEDNALSRKYLGIILENIEIAEKEKVPVCQDTGLAVFFVRQGAGVIVDTGEFPSLEDVINEGLRIGSRKGYLRNSVVDPVDRSNTKDNGPGIIHFLEGRKEEFEISLIAKGFGSENTSALRMMSPTAGKEGVECFIVDTVRNAGSLPCPPIFVGVGIGGSFEKAALLSKSALCNMGRDSRYRDWERQVLEKINGLGIGAGGFGGRTTALDLRIETFPTHIAGLPVAVNISCWAHRHGSVRL